MPLIHFFAYVTISESNTVSVIDTATNTVVATIPMGAPANMVAVTPDGKHAYVSTDASLVAVIDTATNTVVGSPIPDGTANVAIL